MKNFYTLLLFLFSAVSIFAQAPEKMSYQAVLRDASNVLLTNQEVGMQISILQTTITGSAVYTEMQTATTNINGLVSLEIGSGTSSDNFSAIDWSAGPYFIKTATDPAGGTSYSITGTSQIMSVPFAMYAKTSGNSETNATNISKNTADIATNVTAITANTDKVGYTEALVSDNEDVVLNKSKVGQAAGTTTGDMQYWNGTAWVVVAVDAAGQVLTMNSGATAPEWVTPTSTEVTLAIGDMHAGGIIFYLDGSGQHGLVAQDRYDSRDEKWSSSEFNTSAFAAGIYGGAQNTKKIIHKASENNSTSPAATYASKPYASKDDWYLPSKDELDMMYVNLHLQGFRGFLPVTYWSSTESATNKAWSQSFFNGEQSTSNKYYSIYNVRAVRAF
jgi:hypothetical protein